MTVIVCVISPVATIVMVRLIVELQCVIMRSVMTVLFINMRETSVMGVVMMFVKVMSISQRVSGLRMMMLLKVVMKLVAVISFMAFSYR